MRLRWVFVCVMALWLRGLAIAQVNQPDPWRELMQKGNGLEATGDYAGAVPAFREAMHLAEASNDPRLPISLNALANNDDRLGRFSEAEQLYRRALTLAAKDGKWNPTYALTAGNLGAHYLETGPREKAESMLRESLEIYKMLVPADSLQLALCQNALANLALLEGQFDEAEKLVEASLATFRKHPQPGSEQLAVGLNNLGVIRRRQGRDAEAVELFEESVHMTETGLGPDHPTMLRALANLATMYAAAGRHGEADAVFQRAMSVAEKRLGTAHPLYAYLLLNYAGFLKDSGRKAVAKTLEDRAHTVLRDNARTNGVGLTVDVSAFRH